MEPVDPVDPNAADEHADLPADLPDSGADPGATPAERSSMNRRRFMGVLAVGGAAVLAGSVPSAMAAAPKPAKAVPPALEKEIRKQEKSLADVLKVVREYDLPPGSEPATLFRAMRARRGIR